MPATTTRTRGSRKKPVEIGASPFATIGTTLLAFTHLDAEAQELHWAPGAIVDHLLRTEEHRYGKNIVGRFARDVGREGRAVYYYLATYRAFGVPRKCNRLHFPTLTWSHFQRLVELGVPEDMRHELLTWRSQKQGGGQAFAS
jgi:hypothetical protein